MSSPLQAFKYIKKDTFMDKLDPRAKLALSISMLVASLFSNSILVQLIILSAAAVLIIAAKRATQWIPTLKALTPLLALIFAANLFFTPGMPLRYAALMTLRFLTVTTAFSLFFLTTTPDDMALALEQTGLPREYTLMLTMSLRFVPTLADDVETVTAALLSRGFQLDRGNLLQRAKNYVYLLIPLIVYEVRRSLMIAEALESRAFGATKHPTSLYSLHLRARDYVVILISALTATIPLIEPLLAPQLP